MSIFLEHEQFEGAKVLADIGTKIAQGRAALLELEAGKRDFLEGRAAEAVSRMEAVYAQSKDLIREIGNYHSELVGYRNELDGFLADVLCLLQSIQHWKGEFDTRVAAQNIEIDGKIARNDELIAQIKGQRALLAGETAGINTKRAALREQATKIKDEWDTLGRAKKELNQ